MLTLLTLIYKPCSLDILKFQVIAITESLNGYSLKLRAVHPVGAQGRVEVYVSLTNGRLHYAGTVDDDEDNYHSRGLCDFLDGEYFDDERKAHLAFYEAQRLNSSIAMDEAQRRLDDRKVAHARLEAVIATIRKDCKT